jgi:hypothetical protein
MPFFDVPGVLESDDYGYLLGGSDVIAGLDLEKDGGKALK